MNHNRINTVIAVLFYTPIMANDWYLVVVKGLRNSALMGVISDLLLLISAVGTTAFLASYLKHVHKRLAFGYFDFRFIEAIFIGIGILSVLILISLSDAYDSGIVTDSSQLHASGLASQAVHRWIMILGPNIMLGINTLIYSYLLSKSQLVPKGLAKFGMVTAVLVFIAGILECLRLLPLVTN